MWITSVKETKMLKRVWSIRSFGCTIFFSVMIDAVSGIIMQLVYIMELGQFSCVLIKVTKR